MSDTATITAKTASGTEFTIFNEPIWKATTRIGVRGPKVAEKLRVLEVGQSCIFSGATRNIQQSAVPLKPKKFATRVRTDGFMQVWRME